MPNYVTTKEVRTVGQIMDNMGNWNANQLREAVTTLYFKGGMDQLFPNFNNRNTNKEKTMQDYTVDMADGEVINVTAVNQVIQVLGFLEFRDTRQQVIIAIRAEHIKTYATVAVQPVVTSSSPKVSRKR